MKRVLILMAVLAVAATGQQGAMELTTQQAWNIIVAGINEQYEGNRQKIHLMEAALMKIGATLDQYEIDHKEAGK